MRLNEAIEELHRTKFGKISELKEKIGDENFEKLELTGLLRRGQEYDRTDSYEETEDGVMAYKYLHIEDEYPPSLSEKLQFFINRYL